MRLLDLSIVAGVITILVVPWGSYIGDQVNLARILEHPSWLHPLGTDNLGRDLLVRLSDVFRNTVLPLWAMVVATSLAGLCLGVGAILVSWSRLGRVMKASLYIIALTIAAIPVGIASFVWSVWQERASLLGVMLALALLFTVRVFLQVLSFFDTDQRLAFWKAHESLGGSLWQRLWRYGIADHWRWQLLQLSTFHLQAAITVEAGLSYLGFGVQEPQASFGNMLASHFETYLHGEWWVLIVIVAGLGLAASFPLSVLRLSRWRTPKYQGSIIRRHGNDLAELKPFLSGNRRDVS